MNLEELLGINIQKDKEVEKGQQVGVVDLSLVKKLDELDEEFSQLKESLTKELIEYTSKVMAEAEAKSEAKRIELQDANTPAMEALNEKRQEAWAKIYDELLMSDEERTAIYSVDKESGAVTKHEEEPEVEVPSFIKFLKEVMEM